MNATARQTTGNQTILTLQALRGIAALMVVAQHTSSMWWSEVVGGAPPILFNGYNGVDLFFIISGFIMPLSVRRTEHRRADAVNFLRRRAERIVPLYWLCTTVKVLWVLLLPRTSEHGLGSAWHIAASYLFLPSRNSLHEPVPVLPQGWTLNMEMLFYVLIGFALLLGLRLRVLLPPLLLLLGSTAYVPGLARGTGADLSHSPLLFEFLLGLVLAWRWRQQRGGSRPLPPAVAAVVFTMSFALLLFSPTASTTPFWFAGIYAALAVGSALELEHFVGPRLPRSLLLIGDASYSIYLTHWFLVSPVRWLFRQPFAEHFRVFPCALAVTLLISIGAGVLCYRFVEQPINRYFRVRRRTALEQA